MQDLMPPVNTPDKLFHDGDPTQGIEGTIVTAEWLNNDQSAVRDVQGELIAVLAEAAMTPDPEKQGQIIEAIKKIVGDGVSDGALLKTNNLSDLVDKALAREHLQLKTAATKDVTTSTYDTTAGRVLKVGDYGQGTSSGLTLINSIFDISCTGKYSALGVGAGATATQGMPANSGNTRFSVEVDSIYTNQYWVTLRSSAQTYTGMVNTESKTVTWTQYYTQLNKPSAADVGALPLSGGTMASTGQINVSQVGKGMWTSQNTIGAPVFQNIDTANTSEYWPIFKQHYKQGNSTWSAGMLINEGDFHLHFLDGSGTTANFSWKKDGQFIPPNYANFDARYQAKGNYTPAGQAYTKAESDGRYQVKGNYTPIGTAYTKAESDARYNLKNTATKAANAMTSKDASTGVMEVVMSNITVAANTNVSVTFSTAFPSVCVGVVIAYDGAGHGNDSDSSIAVASYTRTGCVLRANNANGKFMLIAKGY